MTFLTFSFTSLLYYKNLVCNTRNIQDMCSLFMVLVRPLVNSKLLRSQKLYVDFWQFGDWLP